MKRIRFEAGALLLMLGACRSAGPDYTPPVLELPSSWPSATTLAPMKLAQGAEAPPLPDWTRTFDDARLQSLIARALDSNLDLAQARERLAAARASLRRSGAEREPRIDASGAYRRSERSLNAGGASASPLAGEREQDLFEAGFDASWELDLYGGLARAVEASRAELEAAALDLGSARVTLVAELARAYVELRGAQRRREVALAALASQAASSELVRSRANAGLASELDLARAEALVAGTRARLPDYEREAQERSDRIALLLGLPAGALRAELAEPGPVPHAHSLPDLGLPARLLRQRPDLRAAERRLAAQSARIGVAEAQRYPQLRLLGSLGLAATELSDLPEGHSVNWAIGPSLSLPLLDGGRIDAAVELETARTDELALAYRQALLGALKEVEDALAALGAARRQSDALAQALDAQDRAAGLARQLYDAGLSDYLAVLDAERQLFDLQDRLVEVRTREAVQVAAACKALGGGWDPDGLGGG